MIFIDSFYTTKNLAKNGIFILVALIVLMGIGTLIIPEPKIDSINKQIYTLNGFNVKYDDQMEVSQFFQSIKRNKGYLCIGTSESTSLGGKNYFHYLNNDPELLDSRFSLLSGAGRTCGVFIPLFLKHRKEVDSLKVIYFINVVYWREDLCRVNKVYWDRYSSYILCKDVNLNSQEAELFYQPVQAYIDKHKGYEKLIKYGEKILRTSRRKYYHDLYYLMYPNDYPKQFSFVSTDKRDMSTDEYYGRVNYQEIDTLFNIQKTFKHKEWFKPINEAVNYRYEELSAFIKVCQKTGISATFVLGPYNERFISNYSPKSLEGYEKTTQNIKQLLINEGADYIDATDISNVVGAWNDNQHHSSYGAFLIYKKIKQHIYEK